MNIKILGFDINYIYEQEDKTRPLILFIHGFADSQKTFLRFRNFDGKNFRFASLDLPGSGASITNKQLKIEDFQKVVVDFILNVLSNETEIILVSHSLGSASALYAKKHLKQVKTVILLSPFNHHLIDENEEKQKLIRWLIPQTFEDAKDSFINLFSQASRIIEMGAQQYAEKVMAQIEHRKLNFEYMVNNEILNFDYLQNQILKLFEKNDYFIITGTKDYYVRFELLSKIDNFNKNSLVLNDKGHAIVNEAFEEIKHFLVNLINKNRTGTL